MLRTDKVPEVIIKSRKMLSVAVSVMLFTTGCQTTVKKEVSVEEAIAITFSSPEIKFTPPPRTIDALKGIIALLPPAPNDCEIVQEDRQFEIDRLVEKISSSKVKSVWLQSLLVRSGSEFTRGNFRETLKLLDIALDSINNPRSMIGGVSMRGNILVQKTIILSALQDTVAAKQNLALARNAFNRNFDTTDYLLSPVLGKSYPKIWTELLLSLGEAAVNQGDTQLVPAEQLYRNAVQLGEGLHIRYNYYDASRLFADYSLNLMQQGRLAEAELIARQALRQFLNNINPQLRYTAQTAEVVNQFARVLLEQGRLEEAEYLARFAVRIHQFDCSLASSLGYINARKTLASILASREMWPEVIEQFQSIESDLSNQDQEIVKLLKGNLDWGQALIYTGEPLSGLLLLERALSNAQEKFGRDSYEAAEIRGLVAIARAYQGSAKTALEDFKAALPVLLRGKSQLAESTGDIVRGRRVKYIVQSYIQLLDKVYANSQSGTASALSEEIFKAANSSFSEQIQRSISAAVARTSPSDPQLAELITREQKAAKEMNSLIHTLTYLEASNDSLIGGLKRRKLQNRVTALRSSRITLVEEIRRISPKFSQLMNPEPSSFDNVREALKQDEVLLATYVGKNKTYVWAIPKYGEIDFHTVTIRSSELTRRIEHLLGALNPEVSFLDDIPEFDLHTAHQLYSDFFKPLLSRFNQSTHIIYVPHSPLARLPISLLPTHLDGYSATNLNRFDEYRDVNWLTRDFPVSVFPSISTFQILRSAKSSNTTSRPFAGFGDPMFKQAVELSDMTELSDITCNSQRGLKRKCNDDPSSEIALRSTPKTRAAESADLGDLPQLPDTRDEILSIATMMGADLDSDIFLGKAASEYNAKNRDLSQYRVISFATHGLVPGDLNGLMQPALALSSPEVTGNENEDGLLTMGEILALDLNADWIVLSACNTAAAENQGSEAISGLGRAFFYAGARSLLVSNWPVHSVATKELMTTLFDKRATDKNLDRSEALRQARLHLIDNSGFEDESGIMLFSYAHPIFWAPFTLVGDGG